MILRFARDHVRARRRGIIVDLSVYVALSRRELAIAGRSTRHRVFQGVRVFCLLANGFQVKANGGFHRVYVNGDWALRIQRIYVRRRLMSVTNDGRFLVSGQTSIRTLHWECMISVFSLDSDLRCSNTFDDRADRSIHAQVVHRYSGYLYVFSPFLRRRVNVTSISVSSRSVSESGLDCAIALFFIDLSCFCASVIQGMLTNASHGATSARGGSFLCFKISLTHVRPSIFSVTFDHYGGGSVSQFCAVHAAKGGNLILPFSNGSVVRFLFIRWFKRVFIRGSKVVTRLCASRGRDTSRRLPMLPDPQTSSDHGGFFNYRRFQMGRKVSPRFFGRFLIFERRVFMVISAHRHLVYSWFEDRGTNYRVNHFFQHSASGRINLSSANFFRIPGKYQVARREGSLRT